jgi:hypothetical protein
LSYTKLKHQNLSVPEEVRAGEAAKISVEVQNVGKSAGDEVVELYVKALKASTSYRSAPWRASSESTWSPDSYRCSIPEGTAG